LVIFSFSPPSNEAKSVPGDGFWKFNSKLLQDPHFVTKINDLIDTSLSEEHLYPNIQIFWDALKSGIKACAIDHNFIKRKQNILIFSNALYELQVESEKENPNQTRIRTLSQIIAEFEKNEVDSLILHTKLDEIELHEKPSQYFYKRLASRAKKSILKEAHNKNGILETDQNQVLQVAHDFYTDLYNLDPREISTTDQDILLKNLNKTISNETKIKLEAELTLEELENSLKTMENSKTPGLDRISAEFLKNSAINSFQFC